MNIVTWLFGKQLPCNKKSALQLGSNYHINSLAPGRFQSNFRLVIFKLTLVNGGWGISYEIALRWVPPDFTDDKSTLIQVMAWCRQARNHYLSQCWPRSMSPNGVTRPQWVKNIMHRRRKRCRKKVTSHDLVNIWSSDNVMVLNVQFFRWQQYLETDSLLVDLFAIAFNSFRISQDNMAVIPEARQTWNSNVRHSIRQNYQ